MTRQQWENLRKLLQYLRMRQVGATPFLIANDRYTLDRTLVPEESLQHLPRGGSVASWQTMGQLMDITDPGMRLLHTYRDIGQDGSDVLWVPREVDLKTGWYPKFRYGWIHYPAIVDSMSPIAPSYSQGPISASRVITTPIKASQTNYMADNFVARLMRR